MLEFVNKGFWTIVPYRLIKTMDNLRLSPLGIIPQRDCRPQLIVDYSFGGVNDETVSLSPNEAMQFGRAVERLPFRIRNANPQYGPTYMAKVDLAHGFYRLWLASPDIPKLGVVFPTHDDEKPLVALPLTLPMGWVASPPYFCAATETVADLANSIPNNIDQPLHALEHLADTPPAPLELPTPIELGHRPLPLPAATPVLAPLKAPVQIHNIYVDDFMSVVQGSARKQKHHRRALLHSLDKRFRPLDAHDPAICNDVPSLKKFAKGDACYTSRKILLGWIVDSVLEILALPAHQHARLLEIFSDLKGLRWVSLKKWYRVLGKLRSMTLAIPDGQGLFSHLQTGFKHQDKFRIKINPGIRAQLDDFEYLAHDLGSRPTRLAESVPDLPAALGASGAAKAGMGGVWEAVPPRTSRPSYGRLPFRPTCKRLWSPRAIPRAPSPIPILNSREPLPTKTSRSRKSTAVSVPPQAFATTSRQPSGTAKAPPPPPVQWCTFSVFRASISAISATLLC
jgi:hypothetical protein